VEEIAQMIPQFDQLFSPPTLTPGYVDGQVKT
jgi:hypothetical protein